MKATKPTVTTTPTVIVPSGGTGLTPRASVVAVPTGGATVYVGGPDVDATLGFPVAAGTAISVDVVQEALYAVVASGTQAVNVLYRES